MSSWEALRGPHPLASGLRGNNRFSVVSGFARWCSSLAVELVARDVDSLDLLIGNLDPFDGWLVVCRASSW
jgi:hypothetical protein